MKKLIFVSLFLIVLYSCRKDFVVEDIKNKTITVNAPADNLVTSINLVTFWWEPVDGAEKYNVQVVKPSFASVAQLIADTNITGTKLNLSLNPGIYQWRIKATNAGGATAFQTYSLKIDSTTNLTNQLVVPISPLTGLVTANKTFTFSWNSLSSASSYSVELTLNNAVINYSITTATSYAYTFTLASAANYTVSWRVKALNATSVSQYNTPQTFTIDLKAPSAVSTPTYPTSNPFVKDTFDLRWTRNGAPDAQYDSLFIYTDASFNNLVRTTTVSATSIKINAISPASPLAAGTSSASPIPYWWRLKSIDGVGNATNFSSSLNFQLIQ
ncbi:MAG: hypothetical protein ABIP51_07985 [Bacteroidia bacterium]